MTEPIAPGAGELFEMALTAAFQPGVFRAAAARPAPSFAAAGGLAMAAGAAALAVNLAHGFVETPDLLQHYPPAMIAAVGVAALGLCMSLLLLLAVMLYGLGSAMGGKGGFDRGLQAAAMLSVLWPVQMMCNWFPFAWMLPAALAAWMAASALEGLFGAAASPARAACAVLGAAAIGLQFAGRAVAGRAREAYDATRVLTQAAGAETDMSKQLAAFQQQAAAAAAAAMPSSLPAPEGAPIRPAPAASGLDLLKGPDDGAPPPQPEATAAPAQAAVQQSQAMQSSASGMLDAMMPMLNNPALTRNMTPQQKKNMLELKDMILEMKTQLASGTPASNADFAARMQRIQQLSMQMMSAGAQPAPAPAAAPSRPHLKLPEDGR